MKASGLRPPSSARQGGNQVPAQAKPSVKERRDRREELTRAALDIFATKGYAATSMQDLADAVGLLKGSLYHYIDSKEDLLFEIFEDAHLNAERLMSEVDALDVDAVARLRYYLERSIRNTLDNLQLQTLYFRDWRQLTGERRERLAEYRRQYERYLRHLINDAHEFRGVEPTVNPRYISSFVIGGTNWVADWYNPIDHSAVDVVAAYAELAMATVLGPTTETAAPRRAASAAPARAKRASRAS
jgi:AcrR family transcriptional regulator